MRAAGLDIIQACGALELLWHATARLTPKGDIGKYPDLEIEEEIGWTGEPGRLIRGFIESGWIDQDETYRLIVHDWHDHADDSVKKLLKRHRWDFVNAKGDMSGKSLDMDPLPEPNPHPVPKPEPLPKPEPNPAPVAMTNDDQDIHALAYQLGTELSSNHPVICSPPKARTAAERALFRFRGPNLLRVIQSIRETHAAHCKVWRAALERNPRTYVPHLHIWFEEEQYLQRDVPHNSRGQPDKMQAVREQFDQFVMRDLEDAQRQQTVYTERS